MAAKGIVLIVLMYVALVWVGAAYLYPADFVQKGLFLTGLGLALMLVFLVSTSLYGWWRGRQAKRAARPKPASQPTPGGISREDDLGELLKEAAAKLRSSPAFAGKRPEDVLSGMPLYLLIGSEKSGKTSIFVNSEASQQLLASLTGVDPKAPSPTRLANIWLWGDALLIEIGGRHFGGDSGRWDQLLASLIARPRMSFWQRLLKSETPGLSLRGVIYCCDVRSFLGSGIDELERQSLLAQERLRAIVRVFRRRFPVYTIFTKTDQVPYFRDFFGRFAEKEIGEVFGCTLPLSGAARQSAADGDSARLSRSFENLYLSLVERRLAALFQEPNAAKKPNIYEFPREFNRIQPAVVNFLLQTFRPNPLQPGPVNRGFYFSGIREVESMEAWVRARPDASAAKVESSRATMIFRPGEQSPNQPGASARPLGGTLKTQWVFTSELFRDVLGRDRPAVLTPVVNDRRSQNQRNLAAASGLALCGLLLFFLTYSWAANRSLLSQVEQAAADPAADLNALSKLGERVKNLGDDERDGPPFTMRWGLYAGSSVHDAAREAYFRRLRQLLLDKANAQLASFLESLPQPTAQGAPPSQVVIDRLKTHLMIAPPPVDVTAGACKPQPALVSRELRDTIRSIGWTDDVAARLVDIYANELPFGNPVPLTFSEGARNRALDYLRGSSGMNRSYRKIVDDISNKLGSASLTEIAPDYARFLEGRPEISAAFTPAGWEELRSQLKSVSPAPESDACLSALLHDGSALIGLSGDAGREIEKLYAKEYVDAWRQYLSQLSVRPFRGPQDAADKLAAFARHDSPLLALFKFASVRTTVLEQSALSAGIVEKTKVTGGRKAEAVAAPSTAQEINAAFQPLHEVVVANGPAYITDKNAPYTVALQALANAMLEIARSKASAPDPQLHMAALQAHDKAIDAARGGIERGFTPRLAGGMDTVSVRLLEQPILLARKWINVTAGGGGGGQGEGNTPDPGRYCDGLKPFLSKYPFNPSAPVDLTLPELSDFLAPARGAVWKGEGAAWKQNPAAAPPELTDFLNKAQRLSDAFFAGGSSTPQLIYELGPMPDPGNQAIQLKIDGHQREFNSSSVLRETFTWPAPAGGQGEVIGTSSGPTYNVGFTSQVGLWAVFKMFRDAAARQIGTKSVEWNQSRAGSGPPTPLRPPVHLNIVKFPGDVDVFNPAFFESFKCSAK